MKPIASQLIRRHHHHRHCHLCHSLLQSCTSFHHSHRLFECLNWIDADFEAHELYALSWYFFSSFIVFIIIVYSFFHSLFNLLAVSFTHSSATKTAQRRRRRQQQYEHQQQKCPVIVCDYFAPFILAVILFLHLFCFVLLLLPFSAPIYGNYVIETIMNGLHQPLAQAADINLQKDTALMTPVSAENCVIIECSSEMRQVITITPFKLHAIWINHFLFRCFFFSFLFAFIRFLFVEVFCCFGLQFVHKTVGRQWILRIDSTMSFMMKRISFFIFFVLFCSSNIFNVMKNRI